MNNTPRLVMTSLAAISLLTATGCVTDPNTGQKRVSGAAIGAGIGAMSGLLVGGIVGGSGAQLLGAGIGGMAGGVIGAHKDQQRKEQTAGRGVEVTPSPSPSPRDENSGLPPRLPPP